MTATVDEADINLIVGGAPVSAPHQQLHAIGLTQLAGTPIDR